MAAAHRPPRPLPAGKHPTHHKAPVHGRHPNVGPRGVIPAQTIQFVGSLTNGEALAEFSFDVLAGQGAPTVTAGFAKWSSIERPQRVSMTVLQGYDPITMTLPILFEANSKSTAQQKAIEGDIQKLEWMGGRGMLYSHDGGVGRPGQGDSPLVQVFTTDSHGTRAPLIPLTYQTDDLYWVVDGLAFDANPMRNTAGVRVRQAVTVTLLEYVAGPNQTGFDSPATRARTRRALSHKATWFHTTQATNTLRLVAAHFAHPTTKATNAIRAANPHVRLPHSIDAPIPVNTRLRIPATIKL